MTHPTIPTAGPRGPFRDRAGFTLVELLVVLILIGIATSLAAPRLDAMLSVDRVRGATSQLAADVAQARMTAIHRAQPVRVVLSGGSTYTIDAGTAGGTWQTLRTVDLAGDYVGVSAAGVGGNAIEFDSRGIRTNSNPYWLRVTGRNSMADSIKVNILGSVERAD